MKNIRIQDYSTSAATLAEEVYGCVINKLWDDASEYPDNLEYIDPGKITHSLMQRHIHNIGIGSAVEKIIECWEDTQVSLQQFDYIYALDYVNYAGKIVLSLSDINFETNPKCKVELLRDEDGDSHHVPTRVFALALRSAGSYMANMTDQELNLILKHIPMIEDED